MLKLISRTPTQLGLQIKRMTTCLLLGAILALLTSCGSIPVKNTPAESEISQLIPADQLNDYLQLAQSKTEPQRSRELLLAANSMLKLDKYDWARNTLNSVNPYYFNDNQLAEYFILHGAVNLAIGDPYLAQRYLLNSELNQLIDRVDQQRAIRARELRATLLYDLAEYRAAIKERVRLSQLLQDDPDYDELNRDLIWQALMELPQKELLAESKTQTDPVIQGWYSLASLSKNNQANLRQQLANIEHWTQVWPDHPASAQLPADLLLLKQLANSQAQNIAVLLPLTGRLQAASTAIRDGILAAYYEANRHESLYPQIHFYDTNEHDIQQVYDLALSEGAQAILGPLSKENIAILATRMHLPVTTLALNNLNINVSSDPQTLATKHTESQQNSEPNSADSPNNELDTTPLSSVTDAPPSQVPAVVDNLFQFGLAVEDEATQVAERAWRDGHRRALLIVPDRPSGARSAEQFIRSWQQLGGEVVGDFRYRDQQGYAALIEQAMQVSASKQRYRQLRSMLGESMEFEPRRRQDIDMIFLVSRPREARQLKPTLAFHYGGDIPVYATSDIYTGDSNIKANQDINGIRFTTLPWFFDNTLAEKKSVNAYTHQATNYQQLYALGIDAYRLFPRLKQLQRIKQARFHGATGKLSVSPEQRIERQQLWAEFRNGRAQPMSNTNLTDQNGTL